MGIRKTHIQIPGYYFITFTNCRWLPLFELSNGYDLVYQWFDYLRQEGHHIAGYVIMPNHLHLMLAFNKSGQSLNTLVGNGKRFMAYEMIKRLQAAGEAEILQKLKVAVTSGERAKGKLYKVFNTSFDLQHCYSQKFMVQKLKYIHDNPCAKKWRLADCPSAYKHSSAFFYEKGGDAYYPVVSWLELEAGDWIGE